MLLILLKGCLVQYKTGGNEEENEQLFLFQPQSKNGFTLSLFKLVF